MWDIEGTGHSDGMGLAKLVKYHPEVVEHLQEILNDMVVIKRTDNRINLESETDKAAVRLTWNNEAKKWLLTAFEKKETPKSIDKTTDTGDNPTDKRGDTTLSQNSGASDRKVTNSASDKQEVEGESLNRPVADVPGIDKKGSLGQRISEAEKDVDLTPTEAQNKAGNNRKGHEVVVSNQEKRRNVLTNLLMKGKLVWKHADNVSPASDVADGLYSSQGNLSDPASEGMERAYTKESLLPNSSEWHLAEHPSDVPDLLPTQGKSEISDRKVTNSASDKQEVEGESLNRPVADVPDVPGIDKKGSLGQRISEAEKDVDLTPTEAQNKAGNNRKGHEVVVSNQEKRRNVLTNLLMKDKLVWKHADNVSPASDVADGLYSSQGNLSDPASEGTDAPQTNNVLSDRKVTNSTSDKQENSVESSVQPTDNKEEQTIQTAVEGASSEVNTEPTAAQAEAGNYKKGHVTIGEFDISIENPAGSVRKGVDADGNEWSTTMANAYGYIKGTEGVDGDHIDVFLHQNKDEWNGRKVYVVDQTNTDGSFDEHKVMLGFNEEGDALSAYLANYDKTWADTHPGIRISETNIEDFNKWVLQGGIQHLMV